VNGKHEVALWAGVVAFFGSLLAIGIFDVLNPDQWAEYLGAFLVAFITGGSVYAKQRYDDAKAIKEASTPPISPTTYTNPREMESRKKNDV
jgi:uncharacterized membrane protein YjjB (DUF3815 family)